MQIKYNPKLKDRARLLRKNSTKSEIILWKHLKAQGMKGFQFMRQKPIDEYIVDFYCGKLKLAIEIDGASHEDKSEADEFRQKKLESLGISFLRFEDRQVKGNILGVLKIIEEWIDGRQKDFIKE